MNSLNFNTLEIILAPKQHITTAIVLMFIHLKLLHESPLTVTLL